MIRLQLEGAVARIRIAAGRHNVLGRGELEVLEGALGAAADARALVIEAAGADFSLGASIEEHLPGRAEEMLPALGRVLRAILRGPPSVAAVQGRCLGGGLELALACTRIVASPEASLGLPEVKLGVFAPAGAVLLPLRVGPGASRDLLLRGRIAEAPEALRIGLIDELAEDPIAVAAAWAKEIASLSAVGVAFTRRAIAEDVERQLERTERLYLEELLRTSDGVEGIAAFLDKRAPRWCHR